MEIPDTAAAILYQSDATTVVAAVSPKLVTPAMAYAPFFTGFAAIFASVIAGSIALRSIRSSRKNLIDQLRVQRELADQAHTLQRELAARASWASVVSTNRQKWVDALREDLAAFITADTVLAEHVSDDENSITDLAEERRAEVVAKATIDRLIHYRRIQLRLNPDKPAHKALWSDVRAVSDAAAKEHRIAMRKLIVGAQALLRGEWERVKSEASGADAPLHESLTPAGTKNGGKEPAVADGLPRTSED